MLWKKNKFIEWHESCIQIQTNSDAQICVHNGSAGIPKMINRKSKIHLFELNGNKKKLFRMSINNALIPLANQNATQKTYIQTSTMKSISFVRKHCFCLGFVISVFGFCYTQIEKLRSFYRTANITVYFAGISYAPSIL